MLKFQIAEDKNKVKAEFDVLPANGKSVVGVDVKFRVHDKDIGMPQAHNPYGDGKAAEQIVKHI